VTAIHCRRSRPQSRWQPDMAVACWGSQTEPFQLVGKPPIQRSDADTSLASYTEGHLGFHGWMRVVDARIRRRTLIGVMDLPDRCWLDSYDDEVNPIEAADEALEEEGCPT